MANVPIVTDLTFAELTDLIAANGLEEGLQYKVTDKNWLLTATGNNSYIFNFSTPYKVYTALVSQVGTNNPTATVLNNTIGEITITRQGLGIYFFELTGAFVEGKTSVIVGPGDAGFGGPFYAILDSAELPDAVAITTASVFDDASADGLLGDTFIEIRVYQI
jgi:hypothetical protein